MPRKQVWTVRVINYEDRPMHTPSGAVLGTLRNHLPGVWVEQLRRLGYVRELASFEDPPRTVLEFPCHVSGVDSRQWADDHAARMQSFGIDATAAPAWDEGETEKRAIGTRGGPTDAQSHMERLNRPRT